MRATLLMVLLVAACGGRAVSPEPADMEQPGSLAYDCPVPWVFCSASPPACPPGTYPEATDYAGGDCPERCWTGRCEPCDTDCDDDDDCTVVWTQIGDDRSWSCTSAVAIPITSCGSNPNGCAYPGGSVCVCSAFARCEGGTCRLGHECEPNCTGPGTGCPPP